MLETINSYEEFQKILSENEAAMVYFSHEECNVCKVLKPKVAELLSTDFPKIKLFYVDVKQTPMISGQERIFAVPTLIGYFDGREFLRKSRNIGLEELRKEIDRPYSMMFEE